MISNLLVRDLTISRAATMTDEYGRTRPDWANATDTAARGWISTVGSSEDNRGRDAVDTTWRVFLPAGTDVQAGDRIAVESSTWEVVGDPSTAWTTRGPHHVQAAIRRVTG